MVDLSPDIRSKAREICVNDAYPREIWRAEDAANHVRKVSGGSYFELVKFMLLRYTCRNRGVNTYAVGRGHKVDPDKVALELESYWGKKFRGRVSGSLRPGFWPSKICKEVSDALSESKNPVRDVAIFSHVFSFLKENDSDLTLS